MLGAIPYAIARPVVERVAGAVNARREASGEPITNVYNDPVQAGSSSPKVVAQELDIKFGLAAGSSGIDHGAALSVRGIVTLGLLMALDLTAAGRSLAR